jgi:hypothetical protein
VRVFIGISWIDECRSDCLYAPDNTSTCLKTLFLIQKTLLQKSEDGAIHRRGIQLYNRVIRSTSREVIPILFRLPFPAS